jgi:DNA repair protein RadA/Sms
MKWNSMIETIVEVANARFSNQPHYGFIKTAPITKLADVTMVDMERLSTTIEEFDRVLGGGLVPGSLTLIGGDPGIGKSTLLLQALTNISQANKALYISGEESGSQIALRAKRMVLDTRYLDLQTEIQLEKILSTLEKYRPSIVVIDSIQTIFSEKIHSVPGSVVQVRECAAQLTRIAKSSSITIIMVGHVTKEGSLAGPRVLEHIVDTLLYFEGDPNSSYRLIRSFKNRFGAINELGIFSMTEKGLKGISNPSALFLSQYNDDQVPGSCIMVTQEGTRPLLVEIQALVDTSHLPSARRLSVGLDQNRLAMLLAVLHRHAGITASEHNIFINAVGGIRIAEPASDLAVIMALYSSIYNQPLSRSLVVFGEIGLAGEIRPAPRSKERLHEASRLGFSIAMIPKANALKQEIKGMRIIGVSRIRDALDEIKNVANKQCN